jgi:hypothetical protein
MKKRKAPSLDHCARCGARCRTSPFGRAKAKLSEKVRYCGACQEIRKRAESLAKTEN